MPSVGVESTATLLYSIGKNAPKICYLSIYPLHQYHYPPPFQSRHSVSVKFHFLPAKVPFRAGLTEYCT